MAGDYEIQGFIETPGRSRAPLLLRISGPKRGPDRIDYCCRVHLPAMLKQDKEIYGVDPEQAVTLSKNFARTLLAGQKITDVHGNPVSF